MRRGGWVFFVAGLWLLGVVAADRAPTAIAPPLFPVPQDSVPCAQGQNPLDCIRAAEWTTLDQWTQQTVSKWFSKAQSTDFTLSGDTECQQVETALLTIFGTRRDDDGYVERGRVDWKGGGVPKDPTNAGGHYKIDTQNAGMFHAIAINTHPSKTDDEIWASIKHEAAHHAGFDDDTVTANHFDAYDAEKCDQPPPPDDNGGGGSTGVNCDTYWEVAGTEWVYVPPESCSENSGGGEGENCDEVDENNVPVCSLTGLEVCMTQGYWVKVTTYREVTVCY